MYCSQQTINQFVKSIMLPITLPFLEIMFYKILYFSCRMVYELKVSVVQGLFKKDEGNYYSSVSNCRGAGRGGWVIIARLNWWNLFKSIKGEKKEGVFLRSNLTKNVHDKVKSVMKFYEKLEKIVRFISYWVWVTDMRARIVSRWMTCDCWDNLASSNELVLSTWYFSLTNNRGVGFLLGQCVTLIK